MTRWLRLVLVSAAAGAVVARHGSRCSTAAAAFLQRELAVLARHQPRDRRTGWSGRADRRAVGYRRSRPALAWTGLTATFLAVAATGCVLAAGIVVGIGLVPAAACGIAARDEPAYLGAREPRGGHGMLRLRSRCAPSGMPQCAERSVLEAERERAEKLLAEARLASLESRLHPHFLFNTLNAISALIPEDPERAPRSWSSSSRRCSASRSTRAPATRCRSRAEVEIVRAYLGIEQARLGERLRYSIELPAELASCAGARRWPCTRWCRTASSTWPPRGASRPRSACGWRRARAGSGSSVWDAGEPF